MTKEEMAEEYVRNKADKGNFDLEQFGKAYFSESSLKQALVAGLKIGREQRMKEIIKEYPDFGKGLGYKMCMTDELAKRTEQIEALNKDKDYFSDALDKQIEATYKVVEKLNRATEILKVVLNKWKEERWILQSEKEVKMIENVMKEAEKFLED